MRTPRETSNWFPVLPAVASGAGLAILQLTWYYVANAADLAEPVRSRLKALLFFAGAGVLLFLTVKVAVHSGDWWIRRVSLTVTCTMSVAWMLTFATLFLMRGRLGGNSALIGEPAAVRLVGGVVALAMYVLLALGPALLVSFFVRRFVDRQTRRSDHGGAHLTP